MPASFPPDGELRPDAAIRQQFALAAHYGALLDDYAAHLSTEIDQGDLENTLTTAAQRQYYFDVGGDAALLCVNALVAARRQPPRTILDYPSGSGRVARHLTALFADAAVTTADLYDAHVGFCVREFATTGVTTPLDVESFRFGNRFDLIFCGSLLTHLPRRQTRDVLRLIAASLSPTGLAVVTFHGRRSDHIQASGSKYLSDRRYRLARHTAEFSGFGYANYDTKVRSKFFKQRSYGISLVRPWWVARQVLRLPDVRLLGYQEMGWSSHQDVVVFGRPGPDAEP